MCARLSACVLVGQPKKLLKDVVGKQAAARGEGDAAAAAAYQRFVGETRHHAHRGLKQLRAELTFQGRERNARVQTQPQIPGFFKLLRMREPRCFVELWRSA